LSPRSGSDGKHCSHNHRFFYCMFHFVTLKVNFANSTWMAGFVSRCYKGRLRTLSRLWC
jgi:hypothetical protein